MENGCQNLLGIESLLKNKDVGSSRWLAIWIDTYRNNMSYGYFSSMEFHYKSNIAYSLQYLEFLELLLNDLKNTSVLYSQIVKNFVITSVSIIELLFFHIAKTENKIKLIEWRKLKSQDKKNIKHGSQTFRISEVIYEKLVIPEYDKPTFETLIQIVADNNYLRGFDVKSNKNLFRNFRKLRNKVHLSTTKSQSENDYNTFGFRSYFRAKLLLFTILTDEAFNDSNKTTIFNELYNTTISQIQQYRNNNTIKYIWKN